MKVKINGVVEDIAEKTMSIARLLELRKVESPEMVSVQLNGDIIDRSHYGKTTVTNNDEVDFLYFMGGGGRR
jgi:sulfur carrier protein